MTEDEVAFTLHDVGGGEVLAWPTTPHGCAGFIFASVLCKRHVISEGNPASDPFVSLDI